MRLLMLCATAVLQAGTIALGASPQSATKQYTHLITSQSGHSVPAENRLKDRITQYHKAQGARDSKAMYLMESPFIRSHMNFEEYKKDWHMDEKWSCAPRVDRSTKIENICYCGGVVLPNGSKALRCVMLLDFTDMSPGGQRKAHKSLEMWEYIDGEWYFGYPGEGEQSCPGAPK